MLLNFVLVPYYEEILGARKPNHMRTLEIANTGSPTGGGGPPSQTCFAANPGTEDELHRPNLSTQRWIHSACSSLSGGGRTLPEVRRPRNRPVGSSPPGSTLLR